MSDRERVLAGGDLASADRARTSTLAELFERYHSEIYQLSLGMLGNPSDAEDTVQEVFLRAHRAWAGFDPDRASPRTWLGSICMNCCYSVLRRRQVVRAVRHLFVRSQASDDPGQQDMRMDIRQALQHLSDAHRSVVILRYFLNYSCAEIAALLSISEGTVHSRLFTARKQIQGLIDNS